MQNYIKLVKTRDCKKRPLGTTTKMIDYAPAFLFGQSSKDKIRLGIKKCSNASFMMVVS
jgi:hypothetical protein